MKILLFCNKSPYPPKDGGALGMEQMVRSLVSEGHDVWILAFETPKFPIDQNAIPEEINFRKVFVDNRIKAMSALRYFFLSRSYHVDRFITNDVRNALTELLIEEKFDIIQFETVYTTPYIELIREYSDASLVFRVPNIEHTIWERITENTSNPIKKIYLRKLSKTLAAYETKIVHQIDAIMPVSKIDEQWFHKIRRDLPSFTNGHAINTELYTITADNPHGTDFFHLGAMDWMPNIEGIDWMLEKIWPQINTLIPDAKFRLAGRNMSDNLLNRKESGLIIEGEVPDARAFMANSGIMLVPVLSGSGIRIKIMEGLALGIPIITTSIGAEGLNCVDGRDILIADSVDAFVEQAVKLHKDKDLRTKLSINSRKYIKENHSFEILNPKISSFLKTVVDKSQCKD